jgi:hypothetical protein
MRLLRLDDLLTSYTNARDLGTSRNAIIAATLWIVIPATITFLAE